VVPALSIATSVPVWLRRFKTLCRKAKVEVFTIHVTQQLGGHSDIRTTQEYYLSVQSDDLAKAKQVQTKLMTGLKDAPPTDLKLTHSAQKRDFPKRKEFGGVAQPPSVT
jgi:hypothetical protein